MSQVGPQDKEPGPLAAVKAVFCAFFGVRGSKAHEEVSHLRPVYFVVAGIVGAALFVLVLVTLVHFVTGKG
ncbi:MAG: hypothetical protein DI596_12975 [Azospira oryzae]|nr:MAG: hypothetical protein DI596_12975 [Azospira oryzae]PZP77191.1 MAG: hypothetical protein DI593_12975 [Azospira oryzae]